MLLTLNVDPDIKSLFNEIGEIGITPIFFNKVDYSKTKKDYVEIKNTKIKNTLHISGTELRNILSQGRLPPDWFMRKEISNMILNKIKNNEEVFI